MMGIVPIFFWFARFHMQSLRGWQAGGLCAIRHRKCGNRPVTLLKAITSGIQCIWQI